MIETCEDMILKKHTTNVALLMGVAFTVTTTSGQTDTQFLGDDIKYLDYSFNNPDNINVERIDSYFNETYLKGINEMELIYNSDIQFVGLIQDFANKQKDLDKDFISALNNINKKNFTDKPVKKRF